LGLAIAIVARLRARTGVEEHLVALEDAAGVRRGPRLEPRPRVRVQRLCIAPMVDRVVEHGLAPLVALQDGEEASRADAVREDRHETAEAARAHVADRRDDVLVMQRRLAAVELE